jgi:hypothetical protein
VTNEQAIEKLEALNNDDPGADHIKADTVLVEFIRTLYWHDVADAYEAARKRVGFWYE